MRHLIVLTVVAASVAAPAWSDEPPEARVSELVRSVFSGASIVPIPCDEDLAARSGAAGLGVSCARSIMDFDGFRDEWDRSLERSPETIVVLGGLPWKEMGPVRMRMYMLEDLPIAVQFLDPDQYVILTFPGTTMWNAGKRSVGDLLQAAAGSTPTERVPSETDTARPSGPPYLAGVEGVSNPQLIPDSRVVPVYPAQALEDGLEATVVLQAVVLADGTVDEIEAVECTAPESGFEEAAIAAVRQWRYEPAMLAGRPVDVYFTVSVTFALR